jgi:outer membrane protein assembly factor BamB
VGDLLVVGSCNGIVHAIDKATGKARWTYDARQDGGRPEFHGLPLVTDELIVIGSDDRRPDGIGYVYAFERLTGKVRWKHRAGAGVPTDVLRLGPRAYAITLQDELVCLDLESGGRKWTLPSGASNPEHFITATPAAAERRVFSGGLNGLVQAADAESGQPIWKRELGARVSTSLAVVDDALYLGVSDGRMLRLDLGTGATLAQLAFGGVPNRMPARVGGLLFSLVWMGEQDVRLRAADLRLAGLEWTRGAGGGDYWSSARPHLLRGRIVLGSDNGQLVALRPEDGSLDWARSLRGSIAGIGSDETTLYVGTVKGTVYALRSSALASPFSGDGPRGSAW